MKGILFIFIFLSSPLIADERGFIYILTNPTYNAGKEKLIKIGQSKDEKTLTNRIKALSKSSAVPEPFSVYYKAKVKNYKTIEKEIHKYLDEYRQNDKREFFKIDPEKAKMILVGLQLAEGQQLQPLDKNFK